MKVTHLSESEIQDFVLDQSDSIGNVQAHLEMCGACQAKANQYRLLFTGINAQPQSKFDFDLSELVIASLSAPKVSAKWTNVFVYSLVTLGLISIVVALILFSANATIVFDSLKKMTLYLLLVSTLVIAGFLGVETYKGYAKKMHALKFY